jgi:hypothetical protein
MNDFPEQSSEMIVLRLTSIRLLLLPHPYRNSSENYFHMTLIIEKKSWVHDGPSILFYSQFPETFPCLILQHELIDLKRIEKLRYAWRIEVTRASKLDYDLQVIKTFSNIWHQKNRNSNIRPFYGHKTEPTNTKLSQLYYSTQKKKIISILQSPLAVVLEKKLLFYGKKSMFL